MTTSNLAEARNCWYTYRVPVLPEEPVNSRTLQENV